MKLNIRKSAIKDLKKINRDDRDKIHKKIIELEKFPDVSNIKSGIAGSDPSKSLFLWAIPHKIWGKMVLEWAFWGQKGGFKRW